MGALGFPGIIAVNVVVVLAASLLMYYWWRHPVVLLGISRANIAEPGAIKTSVNNAVHTEHGLQGFTNGREIREGLPDCASSGLPVGAGKWANVLLRLNEVALSHSFVLVVASPLRPTKNPATVRRLVFDQESGKPSQTGLRRLIGLKCPDIIRAN